MSKLTVIGAGNVGATVAECVARKDIVNEVVLIDIKDGMPQGKALDMMQSAPIHLFDTIVKGTTNYEDTANSDICVITAGLPRKPGMSRDDLLTLNAGIVRSVTQQFAKHSPNAIIIVVSNPLDVMTYVAHEASGYPANRVMGMAGILDTARYRTFLKMALNCSIRDIQAMLLGGHGDDMVPLPRFTTIGGTPVTKFIDEAALNAIVDRTKSGGAELVNLMGTSAWYAPGAAAAEMVEAIMNDTKRVVPCAVSAQGKYGLGDLFVGLPAKLGRNGVEEVLALDLNEAEKALLDESAQHVRDNIANLKALEAAA